MAKDKSVAEILNEVGTPDAVKTRELIEGLLDKFNENYDSDDYRELLEELEGLNQDRQGDIPDDDDDEEEDDEE
jgi:hypothetical protein